MQHAFVLKTYAKIVFVVQLYVINKYYYSCEECELIEKQTINRASVT